MCLVVNSVTGTSKVHFVHVCLSVKVPLTPVKQSCQLIWLVGGFLRSSDVSSATLKSFGIINHIYHTPERDRGGRNPCIFLYFSSRPRTQKVVLGFTHSGRRVIIASFVAIILGTISCFVVFGKKGGILFDFLTVENEFGKIEIDLVYRRESVRQLLIRPWWPPPRWRVRRARWSP